MTGNGSRDRSDVGQWAMECGQLLETGKNEMDSLLRPPGAQPCQSILDFDLQNGKIINL